VSQRVRAALWQEEEGVRPVVVRLLAELSGWMGGEQDDASDELRGNVTP
jgi:hypothetical protein